MTEKGRTKHNGSMNSKRFTESMDPRKTFRLQLQVLNKPFPMVTDNAGGMSFINYKFSMVLFAKGCHFL